MYQGSRHLPRPLFAILVLIGCSALGYAFQSSRIPAGTAIQVRVTENLSSETARVGDKFHGTLAAPVVVRDRTLFSKGSSVTGEVVNVERSGRLSNPGELHLVLRSVRSGGRSYPVTTEAFVIKGESHTKSNVTKIGSGTAAGAIIGAIAGGGKGAAIGAGVGAAAGTGVAAATGKKPAEVQSEAVLSWVAAAHGGDASYDAPSPRTSYREGDDEDAYDGRSPRHHSRDVDYNDEDRYGVPTGFSDYERHVIRDCYVDGRSGLPPGLAKRDRLPPGLERQLQRNGTLPPGLQKRVQPLPGVCTARLPRLPDNWVRVILSGRIILLDPRQRIVDLFWLDGD